jgi:hypothetical protein
MGFDWLFSNWELYIGLAVALAISMFIFVKQDLEATGTFRKKADPETGKKDDTQKKKGSKKPAGGETNTLVGTTRTEKKTKDSGKKD